MTAIATEIVFLVDRSGSMGGLEADTIGGFNAMLEKQKGLEGEARITTVLFDNEYELLHDTLDIAQVAPMTDKEYYVRGSTALLDAIGATIHRIGNAHGRTPETGRASKVLFVITTDGMENASREYDYNRIRTMIDRQKNERGWEFVFLGANMDAVEVAGRFGIAPDRAQNYRADSLGTALNYEVMAGAITHFRKRGALAKDWGEEIQADYAGREGDKAARNSRG